LKDWSILERGEINYILTSNQDNQFGQNNWRIAWEFGENHFPKIPALELVYTTGYYRYLRTNPYKIEFLKEFRKHQIIIIMTLQ